MANPSLGIHASSLSWKASGWMTSLAIETLLSSVGVPPRALRLPLRRSLPVRDLLLMPAPHLLIRNLR